MRRYIVYREHDHKFITKTLMLPRNKWEWGDRKDAVVFTGHTLPILRGDEQIEELPSEGRPC